MTLDQQTAHKIFTNLNEGKCNEWQLTPTTIEARECQIFQARNMNTGQLAAIKRFREPRKNLPQYFKKQTALALRMKQNGSEYRTPEPLTYLADENIYCSEWVEALTADYIFWRYFYQRQRQQKAMRSCMGWLKHYHLSSTYQFQTVQAKRYPMHVQRMLDDTHTETSLVQNTVFQHGHKCLKLFAAEFTNLQAPHALIHGDFTPSNILLTPKMSYGIDIGHSAQSPTIDDLTSMLTYIAVGYPNMLTAGDMRQTLSHWPLPKILLSAYEPDLSKQPDHQFFAYVFLFQILRRWLVVEQRYRRNHSSWLDRWRIFKFSQICQALCRQLEKGGSTLNP